jgi:hypothetical protein
VEPAPVLGVGEEAGELGAHHLANRVTGGNVVNAALIGGATGFVTGLIPVPWLSAAVFGAVSTALNRQDVNCDNTIP